MACVCGHSEEEHGHDPKFPGSTACKGTLEVTSDAEVDDEPCDCIAYESEDEED